MVSLNELLIQLIQNNVWNHIEILEINLIFYKNKNNVLTINRSFKKQCIKCDLFKIQFLFVVMI